MLSNRKTVRQSLKVVLFCFVGFLLLFCIRMFVDGGVLVVVILLYHFLNALIMVQDD